MAEESRRWEKIVKKVEVEEQLEETKQTDFEQKQKEYMSKLAGCSKDHAKEIDLYNKSYEDKVERVR